MRDTEGRKIEGAYSGEFESSRPDRFLQFSSEQKKLQGLCYYYKYQKWDKSHLLL